MLSCSGYLCAEEIKSFSLLGVDGKIFSRYFINDQKDHDPQDREDSTHIIELGADVQTHSYIYHPNFLKIDFGGGPVFIRNTKSDYNLNEVSLPRACGDDPARPYPETCTNTVDETAYDLNVRLNFLQQKRYPMVFYFERKNPLVVPNNNVHFLQENIKFGGSLTYRGKAVPISVTAEAFRLTSNGEGLGGGENLIVDEDLSQANMRFFQTNLGNGHRELLVQKSKQISNSGSYLPPEKKEDILGSDIEASSLDYDDRMLIGVKGNVILRNKLNYVKQDITRDPDLVANPAAVLETNTITQIQYRPDLQWNHSDSLYSFYRVDYQSSEEDIIESENQRIDIGYAKLKGDWASHTVTLNSESETQEFFGTNSNKFERDSYGITGSMDFSRSYGVKELDPGEQLTNISENTKKKKAQPTTKLKLHLGLGYHTYDNKVQDANKPIVVSRPEIHSFDSIVDNFEVTLNHKYIDITTILVRSDDLRITYDEGTDYEVIVVGENTVIRRLLGGRLSETSRIAVNYEYRPFGTFSYDSKELQVQLSLTFHNRINVFVGANRSDNTITEGRPGFAFDSVETRNLGVTADWSLGERTTSGMNARFDKEVKSISPNGRRDISGYYQMGFGESAFFTLRLQNVGVKYDDPVIGDVKLNRATLSLSARPFDRSSMSLSVIGEQDKGKLNPRDMLNIQYKWQWSYRKLFFTLDARHSVEKQFSPGGVGGGDYETERDLVNVKLERRF